MSYPKIPKLSNDAHFLLNNRYATANPEYVDQPRASVHCTRRVSVHVREIEAALDSAHTKLNRLSRENTALRHDLEVAHLAGLDTTERLHMMEQLAVNEGATWRKFYDQVAERVIRYDNHRNDINRMHPIRRAFYRLRHLFSREFSA